MPFFCIWGIGVQRNHINCLMWQSSFWIVPGLGAAVIILQNNNGLELCTTGDGKPLGYNSELFFMSRLLSSHSTLWQQYGTCSPLWVRWNKLWLHVVVRKYGLKKVWRRSKLYSQHRGAALTPPSPQGLHFISPGAHHLLLFLWLELDLDYCKLALFPATLQISLELHFADCGSFKSKLYHNYLVALWTWATDMSVLSLVSHGSNDSKLTQIFLEGLNKSIHIKIRQCMWA